MDKRTWEEKFAAWPAEQGSYDDEPPLLYPAHADPEEILAGLDACVERVYRRCTTVVATLEASRRELRRLTASIKDLRREHPPVSSSESSPEPSPRSESSTERPILSRRRRRMRRVVSESE